MSNASFPSDFQSLMGGLRGGITIEEGELLYRCAAKTRDGCIVEVGSFRGKSAVALALGVRSQEVSARPPIYCIEPHRPFTGFYAGEFGPQDRGAFYEVMCRTGAFEEVALINLSSEQVTPIWQEPVGFAFIDGDHSYEGVRRDFECWEPHLLAGGLLALDDAVDTSCGPYRLIREILHTGRFVQVEMVGKVAVLKKIENAPHVPGNAMCIPPQRILVACNNLVLSGGLLRFERLGTVLRRWGHEVAFLTLAENESTHMQTALPVLSLEQATGMQWDAVMVPGAGFPAATIQRLSALREKCFGIRVQHILNDQSRRDGFMKVNQALQPEIIVFNNNDWPAGSFTDFQANRFHVLLGAVDSEVFRPAMYRTHPLTAGKWVIGGQAGKNPEPLIEALSYLPAHVTLKMFGHDTYQLASKYQALLDGGRLELLGSLYGDTAMSGFYREIDCVVMTETSAGWSNMVAEAMASGIPAVCTPHGTTVFAVPEKTALVIDIPTPEAIASEVRRLMNDQSLCMRLAEQARTTIEAHPWEHYAGQLLQLIRHDGDCHYTYAPEESLYGKWPLAERLQGLESLLERARGMSVVDFGAAEGLVAREFLKRGAIKVCGFDLERSRTRKANVLCASWNNAVFRAADLSDWDAFYRKHRDAIDDAYDIVLYLGIQHHLPVGRRLQTLSCAIDLSRQYFAIRTTPAVYEADGIVELLEAKGFRLMENTSDPQPQSHLGAVRIYQRQQGRK
jgi:hypothetical protein